MRDDERADRDPRSEIDDHGYLFIEPSDERDEMISRALTSIGRGTISNRARLERLEQRIMSAAAPRLARLRQPERGAWDYVAVWARFAIPVAMAASLVMGVAILRSPLPAALSTSTVTVAQATPSVPTLMLGVITGTEASRDAAVQLAAEEPGSIRAWAEIAR